MKERLKNEHTSRLRMILKFGLKAKNKTTAIGALAAPVLRCSFGTINWRSEERKIDRKTRKVLIVYKTRHPKADIDSLYVKRNGGGGEVLLQTEATYQAEIINIAEYLNTKYTDDQFVNIVTVTKAINQI